MLLETNDLHKFMKYGLNVVYHESKTRNPGCAAARRGIPRCLHPADLNLTALAK
jgi:hypothetical protein